MDGSGGQVDEADGTGERGAVRAAVQRLLAEHPVGDTGPGAFARARFDAGLAWVWFPEGDGGLGVAPSLQRVVTETLDAAQAPPPPPNGLGTGMAGPTIAAHGSEEQRRDWLGRVFCSGEWWCQLFSEPGAGSDIASLATRAERDGDGWVVTGQKVWTSGAQHADWGMLVARTDPTVPKHRGLSFFLVDMHSPGVEVRPLRNLLGDAEFNEVFLSEVRVPDRNRVGEVGDGWRVLLATLMNERLVFTGAGGPTDANVLIRDALGVWRDRDLRDPVRRDHLMRLWVQTEVVRLFTLRAGQQRRQGVPGHEGSMGKVAMTELNQRVTNLTMELLGADAMLLPGPYAGDRPDRPLHPGPDDDRGTDPRRRFLRARANTIEGGTSEAQRNNIGDHVLGLPGEPRPDKTLPWSEVPRSEVRRRT